MSIAEEINAWSAQAQPEPDNQDNNGSDYFDPGPYHLTFRSGMFHSGKKKDGSGEWALFEYELEHEDGRKMTVKRWLNTPKGRAFAWKELAKVGINAHGKSIAEIVKLFDSIWNAPVKVSVTKKTGRDGEPEFSYWINGRVKEGENVSSDPFAGTAASNDPSNPNPNDIPF